MDKNKYTWLAAESVHVFAGLIYIEPRNILSRRNYIGDGKHQVANVN